MECPEKLRTPAEASTPPPRNMTTNENVNGPPVVTNYNSSIRLINRTHNQPSRFFADLRRRMQGMEARRAFDARDPLDAAVNNVYIPPVPAHEGGENQNAVPPVIELVAHQQEILPDPFRDIENLHPPVRRSVAINLDENAENNEQDGPINMHVEFERAEQPPADNANQPRNNFINNRVNNAHIPNGQFVPNYHPAIPLVRQVPIINPGKCLIIAKKKNNLLLFC